MKPEATFMSMIVEENSEGKRPLGHCHWRWEDTVRRDLESLEMEGLKIKIKKTGGSIV